MFVTISRLEVQSVFPGNMETDENGFHIFRFTASSREPLTTERLAENTQLEISGLTSLGYQLKTANSNYSYSAAEKVSLVASPLVLDSAATNFTERFITHTTDLIVNYERSQLVFDAQSFLLNEFDRVVCNNPLTRHYCPAYLYLALTVIGGTSNTALKNSLATFVSTLYPNRTLEAFDIQKVLAHNGVDFVQNPITMLYLTHDKDRNIKLVRSESALTVDKTFHIMEDLTNLSVTGA